MVDNELIVVLRNHCEFLHTSDEATFWYILDNVLYQLKPYVMNKNHWEKPISAVKHH